MIHHRNLLRAALLAASALYPGLAAAQTAISEIVVTAQRRAERLQDVPLAVSAVTGASLQGQGTTDIQKLTNVTPGLTMSTQRGALQPYLRGVGTQNTAAGDEGSIAIYVDGVYQPSTGGNVQSLSNIERIEILRGPQGTLFGRNASGGLIHIITKDPTHTPAADVGVGYANYNTFSGSFYGTTGLSESVAVDLAASFLDQKDGWGRNLTTNEDINTRSDWQVRSKLKWDVNDGLSVTLAADYSFVKSNVSVARAAAPNSILPGNLLIDGLGLLPGQSLYDTRANVSASDQNVRAKQYGYSVKVNAETPLGQFQSLTAYRWIHAQEVFDQDGTALGPGVNLATVPGRSPADARNSGLDADLTDFTKMWQQEFLLNSTIGNLDLTSGVFLYYASAAFNPIALTSNALSGGPINVERWTYNRQITRSYAGFMQGSYHLTDATTATAGLRYTRDERDVSGKHLWVQGGPGFPPPGSITPSLPASFTEADSQRNFNKLTYRFALDHKFSDTVMGYVSYSRGFKSGVFNLTSVAPAVFPEVLDATALGIKSDLFDRTVRLNIEAYHYKYNNIQVQQTVAGTTRLLNAARSKINGIDVEAAWAPPVPTGDLRFSTNFSIIDAKYKSFPGAPAFYPAGTAQPANFTACTGETRTVGAVSCVVDASGFRMVYTPKFSGTLAADYRYPMANGADVAFNVTYYYNDGYVGSYDNTVKQPSFGTLAARATYTTPNKAWDFTVWGANLTKEIYIPQFSHAAYGLQVSAGAPRTFGVRLNYHFGG